MSVALSALAAFVLQILLFTCDAEIFVAPSDQTVPVNTITSFFCRARGFNVMWQINDTSDEDYGTEMLANKGITINETSEPDSSDSRIHTFNMNVTVMVSVAINTTTFTCIAIEDRAFSRTAQLIVMGGPATPNVSLDVVNATTLQLSWNPPFTWPEYEILNYTVRIENRSSGITEGPVVLSPTDLTYTLTTSAPVQHCAELRFNVAASNALGDSAPAVVTGGFSKAPVFHSQPRHNIIFQQDGTPNLEFEFELPRVCPYQELSYTITLQRVDVEGDAAIVVGPIIVHNSQRSAPVKKTIHDGLVMDARYSVVVSVNTSGGMSTSSRLSFVNVSFNVPTTALRTDTTTITTTEAVMTENTTLFLLKISLPSVAGGIILIVVIILILIMVILLCRRYRNRNMRSMSKRFPMVPNPIYAGPVYETIDQDISPLPNQNCAPPSPYGNIPTSPAAEPSLDSKFTHFNPEAAVQCNENIDAPTAIISSSVMSEDNYTVMRSPTSTAPPVQPQPAEHENTTMRYVSN